MFESFMDTYRLSPNKDATELVTYQGALDAVGGVAKLSTDTSTLAVVPQ